MTKRGRNSDIDDEEDTQSYVGDIVKLIQKKAGQSITWPNFVDVLKEVTAELDSKKRKVQLRSFSKVLWQDVASHFELDPDGSFNQLDHFVVPKASLPPSFHRKLIRDAAQWLDVYKERVAQDNEAARVRLFEAWHVPICALFKGRIVDRPEAPMPETKATSGGEVEHGLYTSDGILLKIVELKHDHERDSKNNFAQAMVSMSSAYKLNGGRDFHSQPPVYAILTDLRDFFFLKFDGSRFAVNEITVSTRSRLSFMEGMMEVTEQFFSVLLHAFIQTLEAVEARSIARGGKGDMSKHSSAAKGNERVDASLAPKTPRRSLEKRSQALLKARHAQETLVKCDRSSVEEWENGGAQGLSTLSESVKCLPIIGAGSDLGTTEFEEEVEKMILSRCQQRPQ